MILYHGSNTAIDGIDLNRCRPYKDFGRGFYLTDIREQAQRMAARTARMFSGNPTLTMFEFDLEEAQSSELKVKVFKEPDWEWARFVMSNRDLNMIIMLAFRMKSAFCAMIREWITEQLVRRVSEQQIPIVLQISKKQSVN